MAAIRAVQANESLHNIYIKPPGSWNSLRSRAKIYGMCETAEVSDTSLNDKINRDRMRPNRLAIERNAPQHHYRQSACRDNYIHTTGCSDCSITLRSSLVFSSFWPNCCLKQWAWIKVSRPIKKLLSLRKSVPAYVTNIPLGDVNKNNFPFKLLSYSFFLSFSKLNFQSKNGASGNSESIYVYKIKYNTKTGSFENK